MLFNSFESLTVIVKAAPAFVNGTDGHKYSTKYATCSLIFLCIYLRIKSIKKTKCPSDSLVLGITHSVGPQQRVNVIYFPSYSPFCITVFK